MSHSHIFLLSLDCTDPMTPAPPAMLSAQNTGILKVKSLQPPAESLSSGTTPFRVPGSSLPHRFSAAVQAYNEPEQSSVSKYYGMEAEF
eukprot:1187528-Rhodomonas_salina.2